MHMDWRKINGGSFKFYKCSLNWVHFDSDPDAENT